MFVDENKENFQTQVNGSYVSMSRKKEGQKERKKETIERKKVKNITRTYFLQNQLLSLPLNTP